MIRVVIPSQLRSYTGGASQVEVEGATVERALDALDRRFPGLKFRVIDEQDRIRPHMRIFANGRRAADIRLALQDGDEVFILGALSGG